jgi:hypothetical protein
MNITLSDIRLRNFLKSKHGLDLTHRIEMIQSWHDLPFNFDTMITRNSLNKLLNEFGPMYHLKGNRRNYLCQNRNNNWIGYDVLARIYDLEEIYKDVGIPAYLGMKPDELYEVYKQEE